MLCAFEIDSKTSYHDVNNRGQSRSDSQTQSVVLMALLFSVLNTHSLKPFTLCHMLMRLRVDGNVLCNDSPTFCIYVYFGKAKSRLIHVLGELSPTLTLVFESIVPRDASRPSSYNVHGSSALGFLPTHNHQCCFHTLSDIQDECFSKSMYRLRKGSAAGGPEGWYFGSKPARGSSLTPLGL